MLLMVPYYIMASGIDEQRQSFVEPVLAVTGWTKFVVLLSALCPIGHLHGSICSSMRVSVQGPGFIKAPSLDHPIRRL